MTATAPTTEVSRRSGPPDDIRCEVCDRPAEKVYPVHEVWLCKSCVLALVSIITANERA